MDKKYAIFHIEGGLGKHVAATAVAKCIKNNHEDRKLIIVCSYPEIFINLPYVDRVYATGNHPYFYKDYIDEVDSLIFKHEPYFTTDHIHKRMNLIQNWCNLYDLEYSGEQPELSFNIRQQQLGELRWGNSEKPILVIHTNGGMISGQAYHYSWTRDLPLAISQPLVDYYKNDYNVIQICRNEFQAINGATVNFESMSNLELFYLLFKSEKRILIDSCLQHASAAMGIKSTVLWIGTSPNIFGYSIHSNLVANLPDIKLPDSYLFDYNFNGVTHECPIVNFSDMFNIEDIINATNAK